MKNKPIAKPSIDVRGMSISDILKMPYEKWNSLSNPDLKILTQRLNSAANKRIKRLSASTAGATSSALRMRRGGKHHTGKVRLFSTADVGKMKADKASGKLRKAFSDVKSFLQSKTSTYKGAMEVRQQLLNRWQDELTNARGEVSEQKIRQTFNVFHKLEDIFKNEGAVLRELFDSRELQQMISRIVQSPNKYGIGRSNSDIESFMRNMIDSANGHGKTSVAGANMSATQFMDELSKRIESNLESDRPITTEQIIGEMFGTRTDLQEGNDDGNDDGYDEGYDDGFTTT